MNWRFDWDNKNVSLNKVYSQKHWSARSKMKKSFHSFFKKMLDGHDKPTIKTYKVHLIYNSRLDPDNQIMLIKFFNDALQEEGWVENDNKRFCKEVKITPNEEYKTNQFTLILEKLS